LRQFNATVSQKIASSLQTFLNDEKIAYDKAEELTDDRYGMARLGGG